jgi:hypothetical protein
MKKTGCYFLTKTKVENVGPVNRHFSSSAESRSSRRNTLRSPCSRQLKKTAESSLNNRHNPAMRSQVSLQGSLDRIAWFNKWCFYTTKILAKLKITSKYASSLTSGGGKND